MPTSRTPILLFAGALLLAPLGTLADQAVLGIPDHTCQGPGEWNVHDYGPVVTGTAPPVARDGNLEECRVGAWLEPEGDACMALDDGGLVHQMACASDRPADFDGDAEYAAGGAILVADSGDGSTYGGLACLDTAGHHPQAGRVSVIDASGLVVPFTVSADHANPTLPRVPDQIDCGDGVIQPCDAEPPAGSNLPSPASTAVDAVSGILWSLTEDVCTSGDTSVVCRGSCVVEFSPGANGAYVVIIGSGGDEGPAPLATQGHVYSGPAETGIDLGIPGPLALSVFWNGSDSAPVEWVYQGSFSCAALAEDRAGFRIECDPLDALNYHCLTPGAGVLLHHGDGSSVTKVDLDCGSLTAGCYSTGSNGTPCVDYVEGEEIATIVCRGFWDIIVGSSEGDGLPPRFEVVCYSDPPALPPVPEA